MARAAQPERIKKLNKLKDAGIEPYGTPFAVKNKAEEIALNYLKKDFNPKSLPLALELPFQFTIKNSLNKNFPLKIGGRIVAPIGTSIWMIEKESEESFKKVEYPGFAFVPLISK